MLLKEAVKRSSAMRYVVDDMELSSALARRMIYEKPFMIYPHRIHEELEAVGRVHGFAAQTPGMDSINNIRHELSPVKDIRGTVTALRSGAILSDIDLFELKFFALRAVEINRLAEEAGIDVMEIPSMEPVVEILDPEKNRVPHFFIYDVYSDALAKVRDKIKHLKNAEEQDDEAVGKLYEENARLEDEIRVELSAGLKIYADSITLALVGVGNLDIMIAKALQALRMGLCRPEIADKKTYYEGLFNPLVRNSLREKNKDFQPVDISLEKTPCLITGANMGGKTVLLKSVEVAQMMFQYGFFVPAGSAGVVPVEKIVTIIGDRQDEKSGLSSFASEMIVLNDMIRDAKSGCEMLVLIDEPARTTNPVEGEALVNALLDFLGEHRVRSLVTSHYGGINAVCKKLRVKGLSQELSGLNVHKDNIQDYMDYSLTESGGSVPREALSIAGILGVDEDFLETAKEYLRKNN